MIENNNVHNDNCMSNLNYKVDSKVIVTINKKNSSNFTNEFINNIAFKVISVKWM